MHEEYCIHGIKKVEAPGSSEIYQTALCHIPEDSNLHSDQFVSSIFTAEGVWGEMFYYFDGCPDGAGQ
jgi:hypothetical protein